MIIHTLHGQSIFFLLIIFILLSVTEASFLSERQALLSGLEHRYEIRILAIENRMDSLTVETARSQWLPQVSISAGLSYLPFDTAGKSEIGSLGTLYRYESKNTSLFSYESLTVAQQLPGGGMLSGSLLYDNTFFPGKGDSSIRASALALQYTQPLLRNAGQFGAASHPLRIARLNNQEFSLEQKKQLFTNCSDIRTCFWKLFEAQSLVALYRTESSYAQERMHLELTRFSIGVAAPLDTLNARLSLVNASARLHDAESNELQAREELAFCTGLIPDTIAIDSATSLDCAPLPPPEDMLKKAETFDPQLRIFAIAAERLELTRRQQRNSLLPRVDLNASWQRSFSENSPSDAEQFFSNSVIGLIASYAIPVRPRKLDLSRTAALIEKNELDRTHYREQLLLKIRELHRSWERERRSIEIANTARLIAGQSLAASREGYSVGTVDRLSLDKAENDYRTACTELLKKQLLMKQLEILFDEMIGTTLSRLGVEIQ